MARAIERGPPAGTEEAIPADLRQPARQDVVEKAEEKTLNRDRDRARLLRTRVRISEGDAAVAESDEPLIRERAGAGKS